MTANTPEVEANGLFKVVGGVSEGLAPTAKQVVGFVKSYVEIDDSKNRSFNWTSFKNATDNYKGDDLTFDQFKTNSISEGDSKVSEIVQKVVAILESSGISVDKDKLVEAIKGILTNLKQATEEGWGDFIKSEDDLEKSSWEVRIIFLAPLGASTGFFRSYVTVLKLKAQVVDEAGWFDLDDDSELKGFSNVSELMGLVVTKGFENLLFDSIYVNLSPELVPTSLQILRFLNSQIKGEDGKRSFDWPGFKKSLDNYTGDDLSFDTFNQGSAASEKQSLKTLIDKIVQYFNSTIDTKTLTEIVTKAFTNLKVKGQSGAFQFNKLPDKKSSWDYRFVVFSPMGSSGGYFHGTVFTVNVIADIGDESSWYKVGTSTSKTFSATTSTINLVVGKSFQSPS